MTKLTRRALFPLAALGLAAGLFASSAPADQPMKALDVGDAAPAFTLTDQDGNSVSLADYKGKPVVLEWWSTSCPFVVKQYKTGRMNDFAAEYQPKGVTFLAVDSNKSEGKSDIAATHEKWNMDHAVLMDPDGKVGKAYGATNTPHMYVIDADGKVAYMGAIDDKPTADAADIDGSTNYPAQALDQLMAGETVTTPKTKAYGCSVKYAS